MLARLDGPQLSPASCEAARAKHEGQKNRQGWRAGFEFLRLQPFLMLFVLRSQVSQG